MNDCTATDANGTTVVCKSRKGAPDSNRFPEYAGKKRKRNYATDGEGGRENDIPIACADEAELPKRCGDIGWHFVIVGRFAIGAMTAKTFNSSHHAFSAFCLFFSSLVYFWNTQLGLEVRELLLKDDFFDPTPFRLSGFSTHRGPGTGTDDISLPTSNKGDIFKHRAAKTPETSLSSLTLRSADTLPVYCRSVQITAGKCIMGNQLTALDGKGHKGILVDTLDLVDHGRQMWIQYKEPLARVCPPQWQLTKSRTANPSHRMFFHRRQLSASPAATLCNLNMPPHGTILIRTSGGLLCICILGRCSAVTLIQAQSPSSPSESASRGCFPSSRAKTPSLIEN